MIELFSAVMTETTQRKRGGRAYHSVLEPHFDFIQQLRQRRKTWQEIAGLLLSEKNVRVTFHAPYLFYRRKLKRVAKPQWENSAADFQTKSPSAASNPLSSRPAPLPTITPFKRPVRFNLETDQFT